MNQGYTSAPRRSFASRNRHWALAVLTLAVLLAMGTTFTASAATISSWSVDMIAGNNFWVGNYGVSGDRIVWAEEPATDPTTDSEIFTWALGDAAPTQLTVDTRVDITPQISGDRVVWTGDGSVYTWAVGDATPTQLTSSGCSGPQISGERLVWCRSGDVFTWVVGDAGPTQITTNGGNSTPQVSGDRIVWCRSGEVYTWADGNAAPVRLTINDRNDSIPQVSGDRVVWKSETYYTNETGYAYSEIFVWEAGDSQPTQVTDHGYHPGTYSADDNYVVHFPQISGNRIVWHEREGKRTFFNPTPGDTEVFTWEFGDTAATRITDNSYDDSYAQISGDRVVWRSKNGSIYEVSAWQAGDLSTTLIASTSGSVSAPIISGDRVAWFVGEHALYTAYVKGVPVAGTSRYDTAIKTSQAAFADDTADCAVIATGANWPDALGGAALASAKNGPILLTAPTALTAGITDEIDRLGASEVYILGGTGAVSAEVETALVAKMGAANVHRIWGATRYATAEAIAAATIAELKAGAGYDGTAFVATAGNFPDALAASPLAAAKGWPIFLCNPAGDPPTGVMKTLGVTDALILGGTGAVSATQEATLEDAFGAAHLDRLWGTSRYATGVAVATYGVQHAGLGWNGLAMSTGANFPDALAGGVLAARNGSVMLLTAPDALPTEVGAKLNAEREGIDKLYYLGGTGAISQSVRDQVSAILQ